MTDLAVGSVVRLKGGTIRFTIIAIKDEIATIIWEHPAGTIERTEVPLAALEAA